jgi:UDP-N-acetylmuramoyl-tripeptide--D-alanyl-D-alanine ligase
MRLSRLTRPIARGATAAGTYVWQLYLTALTPLWTAQAKRKRADFCRSYIAITGSCGKTTTTMLVSRLLGAQRTTAKGLFANTARWTLRQMRRLDHEVDYFVQEVSEFPLGTLAAMGDAMRPDAAVVTSVGLDHHTEFRNRETVAAEMSTLTRTLRPGGILCLNADDDLARGLASETPARVILYGRSQDADVRAENVEPWLPGRLGFDLVIGDRRWRVKTRFVGTLMLSNILGALALLHALGLDVDEALVELTGIEPLNRRMSTFEGLDGHVYVLDTVKAPLWSTRMVVDDLENLYAGRRIFVLGEMSDTGSNEGKRYRQVLRSATDRADLVIGVGRSAAAVDRVLGIDGDRSNLRTARSMEELTGLLRAEPPSMVLLKGKKLDCSVLLDAVRPQPVEA